jgi:hypothetical protein
VPFGALLLLLLLFLLQGDARARDTVGVTESMWMWGQMMRFNVSSGFCILSISLVFFLASCGPGESGRVVGLEDSDTVDQSDTENVYQYPRTDTVDEPDENTRLPQADDVQGDNVDPEQEVDDSAVDDPPEELINAATVVDSQFPSAMSCGEVTSVFIEMLNTGTSTWTRKDKYKLGAFQDDDPFYKTTRVWLPEDATVPPNSSWLFEFKLHAPEQEGTYTSDWQMVQEWVGWFGDIATYDITVTCPSAPEWEYTGAIKNAVMASATFVRNNYPEFFKLGELPKLEERTIAYKMMTTVLNHVRAKGVNASRCVANPQLPQSNPIHWCSDALVVGPPGQGVTIDIYYSWSDPATPQTSVTKTEATGVVTDDLIALP